MFMERARIISAVRSYLDAQRASSRSRRRCCSRSTAARWRGRSPPTTTRSTATSTCGSPPSSTSSAASSAASSASTSSARTSATRALSHKHNPEFTMVEWYEAYADYEDEAARLEEIVAAAAAGDGLRRRAGLLGALAQGRLRRGDRAGHRHRRAGATASAEELRAAILARGLELATRGSRLARARRRPALQVRRAQRCSSRRSSSTTPSRSRRWPASTARARASSSAGRRSPAAWRSPTPSAS